MIICCENCNKNFEVNSDLIPENGRLLQCGACDHKWFYKIPKFTEIKLSNNESIRENIDNSYVENEKEHLQTKNNQINFSDILLKSFGYFIVLIISIIAMIILLDTFKSPLSSIFPNLELFLFNLIETLKDIKLFIKDLIS